MTQTEHKTINIPVEGGIEEAETPQAASDETQVAELTEQLQRLQAEFTNYKRRTEKEWEGVFTRAKADLVSSLLPVLDDFERLLSHHAEDPQVDRHGVQLIVQKMQKTLADAGLQVIDAVGEDFDPERHQAIAMEPVDEDQDDKVIEEWQKGYVFGDKMLRPSQVKVGRHQAA